MWPQAVTVDLHPLGKPQNINPFIDQFSQLGKEHHVTHGLPGVKARPKVAQKESATYLLPTT